MSRLGKRYECTVCGTTVLCVRPGPEEFECCDQPVVEMAMQELPSGD
jgi:hypothetical protein